MANIVIDTCKAIWETFHDEWMPMPTCDDGLEIAEQFNQMWNFPNFVGALDGKHVVIRGPTQFWIAVFQL